MTLAEQRASSQHTSQALTAAINDVVVDAIQSIKGHEIVKLDLRNVQDAPTDFFIVCHGDSDTQVRAIASNISKEVKAQTGQLPHIEGQRNGSWIIVDYFTTVVHVFYKDTRKFYDIESLWGDADVVAYDNL